MAAVRDGVERFGDRMAALALVRPKQPEPLPILVHRRRIYVLPTGFGLFMGAMLITMLVGGLNYNNNPALLLVFLIAGVALNSLVHSHLLLSGVSLTTLHADPVFAGQALRLKFRFEGEGARDRPGLQLLCGEQSGFFDLEANQDLELQLDMPAPRRGWQSCGRLRLSTLRPLGLARAWSWLRPELRLLVYPALEQGSPPLPEAVGDGDAPRVRSHGEQPHHLRGARRQIVGARIRIGHRSRSGTGLEPDPRPSPRGPHQPACALGGGGRAQRQPLRLESSFHAHSRR
jgi:uncharacterized protein (DUF58 family)